MKKHTPIVAVSQTVAEPCKEYKRTFGIDNINGVQTHLGVAPSCSFDGQRWIVHDDEIRLSIFDIGEYDDRTGEWEDNADVMSSTDSVAWLTFTPQQARQLAHKLLRIAGKCRTAAQVDRSDPELLEKLTRSERHIREVWAQTEKESANTHRIG